MCVAFGWTGKMLRVDLSTGSVDVQTSDRHTAEWIGGRGIGSSILFDEVPLSATAFDPSNRLVLSAGPLVGTLAPAAARMSVCTKNAQTGGFCSSNVGGHFGAEMKYAGFDAIVIEGRAQEPVVLYIHDDSAEILPADVLWGKTTLETETLLRSRVHDPRLRVASIGPAGENLVRYASLMVDRDHAAGRGGVGAVFGSKKLKAIAVRGTGTVNVHDADEFLREVLLCMRKIDGSGMVQKLRAGGSHLAYALGGPNLQTPQTVRNFQSAWWPVEKTRRLHENVFRELYEVRRLACFNCPIYCTHFYSIPEGMHEGTSCEGLQANVLRAFGSNLDIDQPSAVLRAHCLCSQLGLDIDMATTTIGWAFELFQRGIIDRSDTDGLELRWGNYRALHELLSAIAYRRGFGDLLANGVKEASALLGRNSERYAMHIKGAGLNETGLRAYKGWALGIAVSTRGGGHLDGAPLTEFAHVPPDASEERFGTPHAGNPSTYEGKALVVTWFQKFKAIVDMMGMCYFTSLWEDMDLLAPEDYAALFCRATGSYLSVDDLQVIGERVHNIEKAFNTLHAGFSRVDDFFPSRLMEEPIQAGPHAGQVLDRFQWNKMLDDYYVHKGWDPVTGWQTGSQLRALGLEQVMAQLRAQGRLVEESPECAGSELDG